MFTKTHKHHLIHERGMPSVDRAIGESVFTADEVDEINKECPVDQGIYFEPYGIPVHIKELVVYGKYQTGGVTGSYKCHDNERYTEEVPNDRLEVLDLVLEKLYPEITHLQYKKIIKKLLHDNTETEYGYYGNSNDYKIEYIILSELVELINKMKAL